VLSGGTPVVPLTTWQTLTTLAKEFQGKFTFGWSDGYTALLSLSLFLYFSHTFKILSFLYLLFKYAWNSPLGSVMWRQVAERWYGEFTDLPVVVQLNFQDVRPPPPLPLPLPLPLPPSALLPPRSRRMY
jgi:hypothetical protein